MTETHAEWLLHCWLFADLVPSDEWYAALAFLLDERSPA